MYINLIYLFIFFCLYNKNLIRKILNHVVNNILKRAIYVLFNVFSIL